MEDAKAAKSQYKQELMGKPNVVAVGVGYKIVGGQQTETTCVIVFVRRKVAAETAMISWVGFKDHARMVFVSVHSLQPERSVGEDSVWLCPGLRPMSHHMLGHRTGDTASQEVKKIASRLFQFNFQDEFAARVYPDQFGIDDILRALRRAKIEPERSQALDLDRVDFVRAADPVTEGQQKRGDPAHAGTGHTDEVDPPRCAVQKAGQFPCLHRSA